MIANHSCSYSARSCIAARSHGGGPTSMSLLPVPVHPLQTTCWFSNWQCRNGLSERGSLVYMYDVTTKYVTTGMLVTDFFGGLQPPQPPSSGSATESALEMCNLLWTPHSSLEKDNSLNHFCVSPTMGCLEYT